MENVTGKDAELLANIEAHYASTGFPLSLAESAEVMGLSKGSVIADMVKRLEAANVIEYAANRKYYRPTRWRELVAGATPDPNATPEFEALKKEAEALRRRYDDLVCKSADAAKELAKRRKAGVERTRKYREKRKAELAKK